MQTRRFISMLLAMCFLFSSAFAESQGDNKSPSIGDWFSQAWQDTSAWATQAWDDSSAWVVQAWDDSSKWVVQAWDDSSKWVSQAWDDSSKWVGQAWKDSSGWVAGNWSNFVIWLKTVTSDNPYSWIRDMVLDEGILAYDEFVKIRSFLAEKPDSDAIKSKCYDLLSEQSLLNEEKDILWNILGEWAADHNITVEQTATLVIPFIERLNIKGEEALGEDIELSGQAIAQYLATILEAIIINSHEDAESRINALKSSLDNLTRPIVIGEQDQNVVITEDGCYIENFTYADGKYQVFMLVFPADRNSIYPMIAGISIDGFVTRYFRYVESWGATEPLTISEYPAQARRFNTSVSEIPVNAEILQVWAKNQNYIFFIITDKEWKDDELKTWISSIALSADGKVSFAADFSSDGAFYGINQAAQRYTINRYFTEAKFTVPKTGHGWAAERGNNLIDNIKGFFKGQHSVVTGDNNVKNGADRVVFAKVNGKTVAVEKIQTKYCSNAARTINAAFDETGYRYIDADGNPMSLEVPSDQYKAAVKLMEKRIANGEVKNVDPSDTAMAEKIVKKGSLSYQQAKHLAKSGRIESLIYDSYHACIYATSAMGISALFEFAVSLWSGETPEQAIKNSIYSGLKTGGITFVVSVLSSQLLKSGLNSALRPTTDAIVKTLGPKIASTIDKAFRPAGSAIYGAAAMKAASKILRGNLVTGTLTFIALASFDVSDLIQGKISWKQLAKNSASTVAGLAGGSLAFYATSALIGSSVAPGVGTAIGLIVAAIAGWGASEGAKALSNLIAEDDAKEMIQVINNQFAIIAEEYFLNESEANRAIENLQGLLSQEMLKAMYQYGNHAAFARQLIEMSIDPVVSERQYIKLPSEEEYSDVLTETLQEIYTEIGDTSEAE